MSNASLHAREKLFQAVDILVTGSGRVQERLGAAAIKLLPARPQDIPYDDLRRTFVGVMDDLTYARAQGDESRILATLKLTNDEDARAIARRILNLYIDLDERLKRESERDAPS